MARAGKASVSAAARRRAREANARQRELLEQREAKLAAAFEALDDRDQAEIALGTAINELKELGGTHATIAEELGLSSRELSRLVGLADGDGSGDGSDGQDRDDDTDDDSAGARADGGDTEGTSDTAVGDTDSRGIVQPGQYAGV